MTRSVLWTRCGGGSARRMVYLTALATVLGVGVAISAAAAAHTIVLGDGKPVRALDVELYRGWVRVRVDSRTTQVSVRAALTDWDRWTPGADPAPLLHDIPGTALVTAMAGDTARIVAPTLRDLVVLEVVAPTASAIRIRVVHHGNVGVTGAREEVEVETFQGRIALEDVTGPVLAHITRDGDIGVRFARAPSPRPSAISTYEGDIDLEVPRALIGRLSLETTEGEIHDEVALPPRPSGPASSRILVRNARGSIHVRPLR